jgi:predicted phosphodiesterase
MAYRQAGSVAVLADVHGNLPALSAVLAEPDVAAADAVVLLGDIALGPMPAETLEVLVFGHTHMPFDRLAAGRRVVNTEALTAAFTEIARQQEGSAR